VSIQVAIDDVRAVVAEQAPFAYLLTVSEGDKVHLVALNPAVGDRAITCESGRTSCRNANARPNVSLLWPPGEPGGYSLIVDGTAKVNGETITITPTHAVRHRPAPGGGNDCAPL